MAYIQINPVAPVAYQVILEAGIIDQFREFECPRVHTRKKFVGTSRARIGSRKARERELATIHEISTSSGIAEPYST